MGLFGQQSTSSINIDYANLTRNYASWINTEQVNMDKELASLRTRLNATGTDKSLIAQFEKQVTDKYTKKLDDLRSGATANLLKEHYTAELEKVKSVVAEGKTRLVATSVKNTSKARQEAALNEAWSTPYIGTTGWLANKIRNTTSNPNANINPNRSYGLSTVGYRPEATGMEATQRAFTNLVNKGEELNRTQYGGKLSAWEAYALARYGTGDEVKDATLKAYDKQYLIDQGRTSAGGPIKETFYSVSKSPWLNK